MAIITLVFLSLFYLQCTDISEHACLTNWHALYTEILRVNLYASHMSKSDISMIYAGQHAGWEVCSADKCTRNGYFVSIKLASLLDCLNCAVLVYVSAVITLQKQCCDLAFCLVLAI